jgi:hypothetical protein|tara:strand:+ start:111 stop:308 length:198 start_codon:yes stop_codon:yes gene_type:complete
MKRRGQKVKLEHIESGDVAEIVVVLADSKQGYLGGSTKDVSPMVLNCLEKGEWHWYHPSEWSEMK